MKITEKHIGCKVRHIEGDYRGMRKGDIDTVVDVTKQHDVVLKEYGKGHCHYAFELVEEPKMEVTESNGITGIRMMPGDKVKTLRLIIGVNAGREVTIREDLGDYVTLQAYSGKFPKDALEFHSTESSILHGTDRKDFDTYEVGDTAMLVAYGWGVGPQSEALGTQVKIVKKQSTIYTLVIFPGSAKEEEFPYVDIKCLRKVTQQQTKESPVAFKKKQVKGRVDSYLNLITPKTIKEQQTHANRVLRYMKRKLRTEVAVCGGAPRNWDHDKLANDIDVYFYLRGGDSERIRREIESALEFTIDESLIHLGSTNAYYGQPGIKFVYEAELAGQTYQFIVLQSPIGANVEEAVLKNFNCDLCKIAWDPIAETYTRTTEYKTDRDFKRLTYRMYELEEWNAEQSMYKHVPKMMKQFPEHDVYIMCNPEHQSESESDPFRL